MTISVWRAISLHQVCAGWCTLFFFVNFVDETIIAVYHSPASSFTKTNNVGVGKLIVTCRKNLLVLVQNLETLDICPTVFDLKSIYKKHWIQQNIILIHKGASFFNYDIFMLSVCSVEKFCEQKWSKLSVGTSSPC